MITGLQQPRGAAQSPRAGPKSPREFMIPRSGHPRSDALETKDVAAGDVIDRKFYVGLEDRPQEQDLSKQPCSSLSKRL